MNRKIDDAGGDGTETDAPIQQNLESNLIAANAITGKLNEVSKIAESLDVALRETQTILELDSTRRDSLDRKMDGTNISIDSRGSIDVSSPQLNDSYVHQFKMLDHITSLCAHTF